MARTTKGFSDTFPKVSIKDLQKPLLFVVDMINGFVKEGALHDEAIQTITPNIQRLIEASACRVIFVADSHAENAREFTSFPVHCVANTSESEVIEELQPYIQELYHKNSTNTFHCPDFQKLLAQLHAYKEIIITGCCSDICILQFALTLQSWLNEHNDQMTKIIIPIDMIETYHIEGVHDAAAENEFSIRNMAASGIHMVQTIERGE